MTDRIGYKQERERRPPPRIQAQFLGLGHRVRQMHRRAAILRARRAVIDRELREIEEELDGLRVAMAEADGRLSETPSAAMQPEDKRGGLEASGEPIPSLRENEAV